MAFNFGYKGRRFSLNLDGMHSGVGTRVFKKLSSREQMRWSSYDRNMSRLRSRRSGGGRMKSFRF